MALQPAAGAKDLNPREVEGNRRLCDRLASVYRLWGYEEVAPPAVERLETLEAGGAIDGRELVRLAADEPLGLRPEMTASIARAACTRMAGRARPLRLWSCGAVFRSGVSDSGGHRIDEHLQSGVELLGDVAGGCSGDDAELMRLLLACLRSLGIDSRQQPRLLLGHHGVLTALLDQVPNAQRTAARHALTSFNPLALAALDLPAHQRATLQQLMRLRGEATGVLYQLEQLLGPCSLLDGLADTLRVLEPVAAAQGVVLQLDPTFQPHFDLYDGLVLKLVCQVGETPVEIASGGRYDALVGRFGGPAAGMGFSVHIEAIRDLLGSGSEEARTEAPLLVAYRDPTLLGQALDALEQKHRQGQNAELLSRPCASRAEAETLAAQRGCSGCLWLES